MISSLKSDVLHVAVFCVFLAAAAVAMSEDAQMTNLRVPLGIHTNGQIKTQIMAGFANVAENGEISAKDVRIEMFTEGGELESLILAESCKVDRENEIITSTSRIDFERKELKISGRGFEWRGKEQSFKILNDARVVFRSKSIKGLKDLTRQR